MKFGKDKNQRSKDVDALIAELNDYWDQSTGTLGIGHSNVQLGYIPTFVAYNNGSKSISNSGVTTGYKDTVVLRIRNDMLLSEPTLSKIFEIFTKYKYELLSINFRNSEILFMPDP